MVTLVRKRHRIAAKGQTTVPKAVRQALGVRCGGEIAYVIDERGISLRRVETDAQDPVIEAFLAEDMAANLRAITPISASFLERIAALTAGVEVDLNEELDGPVALWAMIVVNVWTLFAHPLLFDEFRNPASTCTARKSIRSCRKSKEHLFLLLISHLVGLLQVLCFHISAIDINLRERRRVEITEQT